MPPLGRSRTGRPPPRFPFGSGGGAKIVGALALACAGASFFGASLLSPPFAGPNAWWNAFGDQLPGVLLLTSTVLALSLFSTGLSFGSRFVLGCFAVTASWMMLLVKIGGSDDIGMAILLVVFVGSAMSLLSFIPVLPFAISFGLTMAIADGGSLDALERNLRAQGAWLATMALLASITLARGGEASLMLTLFFWALGVSFVALAALRNARQRAFLRALRDGRVRGYRLRPVEEGEAPHFPRLLAEGRGGQAVVERVGEVERVAYRSAPRREAIACVPRSEAREREHFAGAIGASKILALLLFPLGVFRIVFALTS